MDTQLKYDSRLVQGMFLHALDTGPKDESIGNQMKPSLPVPGVHDKDLIPKINVIVADEIKRKPKWEISSHQTSTKVYEVGASKRE